MHPNPEKEKTQEALGLEKFYKYRDNSKPGRPVIFECKATSILEADKSYEKAIGVDPSKQNEIACVIWEKEVQKEAN